MREPWKPIRQHRFMLVLEPMLGVCKVAPAANLPKNSTLVIDLIRLKKLNPHIIFPDWLGKLKAQRSTKL